MAGSADPVRRADGIVVYLDVLGTRRSGAQGDVIDYARRLQRFKFKAKKIEEQLNTGLGFIVLWGMSLLTGKNFQFSLQTEAFSDSLFASFETGGNPEGALSNALDWTIQVVHCGLKEHLLLRGAVSVGPMIRGEGVLIGDAVNEAYEWEGLAEWGGVILAPTAELVARRTPRSSERSEPPMGMLIEGSAPMRAGSTDLGTNVMTLGWPLFGPDDLCERLEQWFYSESVPADVTRKHRNTIDYARRVRSEYRANEPPLNQGLRYLVQEIWTPTAPEPSGTPPPISGEYLPPPTFEGDPPPPPDGGNLTAARGEDASRAERGA